MFTAFVVSVTALGAVAGASLMHHGAERWLLIDFAFVVMDTCACTCIVLSHGLLRG